MFKDKGILKACWVGMYILCAVLGFLEVSNTASKVLLIIFSFLFFAPPFADLYFSWQRRDAAELRLVRTICLVSLGGTTFLLVANVLSTLSKSYWIGYVLHYALVLVSVPFTCGQYSIYSLLLWAILLWSCILLLRKLKK